MSVSASMVAALLSVTSQRMLMVFHHHRLAADMAVVPAVSRSGFIMAVFNMNNFILSLTQTNVNMHIGSLGLSTQYEQATQASTANFARYFFMVFVLFFVQRFMRCT